MKIVAVLLAVLVISSCASTSSTVRGHSAVNEQLKTDTYRVFQSIASAQMKCENIEYAEVTSSAVSGQTATETWVAHGCGKIAPYQIYFVPSPMGGYTYSISAI